MPQRTADAHWEGDLLRGKGTMRLGSGLFEGPYTFGTRMQSDAGTNPEELIAAAHAGCFSMALSKGLSDAGFTPVSVNTTAKVHLEKTDAGMTVTGIDLDTVADVPGIDAARFQELAESAKANCPISRLLAPAARISLSARLAS